MTLKPQANWQQAFIESNLLVLGHNAWAGYLTGEKGVVVCSLNTPHLGITGETFQTYYVPRSRLAPFLNAWLSIPDTAILHNHHVNAHILEAVDSYNPTTELVFLLESSNQVTFFYLKNLPITPPQCYEQICKTWDEFQPAVCALKQQGCSNPDGRSRRVSRNNPVASRNEN
ncbi:hypothetical protein BJP34_30205 [Moorena producens PAL-8-15-08-1]|uniref:Uncharacterized protein n=1 Tax=Moorena producens PAL-8-15-08-1 TaxID=1458985 RepID=A0A1D8U0D3_9CYAN|nr:hypothetical protein [Moorena producens]AOX03146.1 hypothetical protein BJP34_30205 [Moorena producens PAL-8-15-08-1]